MTRPGRFLARAVRATSTAGWISRGGRCVLLTLAAASAPADAGGRAEVQINLCAPAHEVAQRLALVQADAARIEAWYFDTRALTLADTGLVLRLRSLPRAAELTLKVRGVDCASLDSALLPEGEGKCEYDLHGDRLDGAVSVNRSEGFRGRRLALA